MNGIAAEGIILSRQQKSVSSVFDTISPAWRRSREAYEIYRIKPSAARLFDVFNECLESGWREVTSSTNAGALGRLFHSFEAAVEASDRSKALRLAGHALEYGKSPSECGSIRFVLAARTTLTHRDPELADAIVATLRDRDELPNVLLDSFLLRLRCRVPDRSNEALFRRLLKARPPQLGVAVTEWLNHRWRYEGPSADQLDEFTEVAREYGLQKDQLLSACLALAARIACWDYVEQLLESFPKLVRHYKNILPLADYLSITGKGDDEVMRYAQLYRSICDETEALSERIGSNDVSCAIVGNSPCEKGTGNGTLIDEHDVVVRFNYFELGPDYERDYGSKFTIHGRGPGASRELAERSLRADQTVICTYDFTHLKRNWSRFLDLWQQGARLACLPLGFHRSLQEELKAEPSLGLAFLTFVKSVRGQLSKESCFGFSFVDQIGPSAMSAHYFDDNAPALTHRWVEERAIFERLVG